MPAIALPTLTDGEVTLRPLRPEDADAITAACQDPEIQRWTFVPSPYTRAHAVDWIQGSVPRARAGKDASLVAVDADDRLLGAFSVMAIDRERGYGEIGYWVAPGSRRRGVATRAVNLLREWAHSELGLGLLEILPHADNLPSRRVAERCGFTATGERRGAPRRADPGEPRFAVYVWRAPGDA